MIVNAGEKVHIVERRVFPEDIQRHFVGEVVKCTEQAMRLKGFTWIFEPVSGNFVRKPEQRERVIPFGARVTINLIPPEVNLDAVKYVTDPKRGLLVTDEISFFLNITEFSSMR